MKRVIELIRVSTEQQARSDRASIPAQKAVNRRTAEIYGLSIVRTIEFSDVSGAAVLYAPEMKQLLELIKDVEIHGVVTREFSRLMRPENFGDYAILQAFAESNTLLYLPDGPLDFSSKTGRLIGTLRASIAGMERQDIIERIWSAKEEKRREGKFSQSRACLPYGVGYSDDKGFYYKPEAEKVKEIFRLFLSGTTGYGEIAKKLGMINVTVKNILSNPIYTGWRVIDKKRDMKIRRMKADGRQGDRPKIKRADDEIIRVKVIDEPLVTETDFAKVQQIIETKRVRHWRADRDYNHRFTYNGFLNCTLCGSLVYTHYRRDDYYVCKLRKDGFKCKTEYMRKDRLEAKLDALFTDRLTDAGFLREVAEEFNRKIESAPDIAGKNRLEASLISLQAKRQRILDAFFDGIIDQAERALRLSEIDKDLVATQEKLFQTEPATILDALSLAQVFAVFHEFKFLKRNDKRRLLSTLIPEIRVVNYEISSVGVMLPHRDNESLVDTDSLRLPA